MSALNTTTIDIIGNNAQLEAILARSETAVRASAARMAVDAQVNIRARAMAAEVSGRDRGMLDRAIREGPAQGYDPNIINGQRVMEAVNRERAARDGVLDVQRRSTAESGRGVDATDRQTNAVIRLGKALIIARAVMDVAGAARGLREARGLEQSGQIEAAHKKYLETIERVRSVPIVGGLLTGIAEEFSGIEASVKATTSAIDAMNQRMEGMVRNAKEFKDLMFAINERIVAGRNRIEVDQTPGTNRPVIEARQRAETEERERTQRQGNEATKLRADQAAARQRAAAEVAALWQDKLSQTIPNVTDADEQERLRIGKQTGRWYPTVYAVARDRLKREAEDARGLALAKLRESQEVDEAMMEAGHADEDDTAEKVAKRERLAAALAEAAADLNERRKAEAATRRRAMDAAPQGVRLARARGDEEEATRREAAAQKLRGRDEEAVNLASGPRNRQAALQRLAASEAVIEAEKSGKIEAMRKQHALNMDRITMDAAERSLRTAGDTNAAELAALKNGYAQRIAALRKTGDTKDAEQAAALERDQPKAVKDLQEQQTREKKRDVSGILANAEAIEKENQGLNKQAQLVRENADYQERREDAMRKAGGVADDEVRAIEREHRAKLEAISRSGAPGQMQDAAQSSFALWQASSGASAVPEGAAAKATADNTKKMVDNVEKGIKLSNETITDIARAVRATYA